MPSSRSGDSEIESKSISSLILVWSLKLSILSSDRNKTAMANMAMCSTKQKQHISFLFVHFREIAFWHFKGVIDKYEEDSSHVFVQFFSASLAAVLSIADLRYNCPRLRQIVSHNSCRV